MTASSRPSTTVTALLHGPDQPGLVAKVAGWIYDRGGNILHADQHRDSTEIVFFQRVEWEPSGDPERERLAFQEHTGHLGMKASVSLSNERPNVVLFVSKADHCLHDLILRHRAGEFRGEIVAVISNHEQLRPEVEGYGLPFHYEPISPETRPQAEGRQLEWLRHYDAGLAVLARYMQVLSASMLDRAPCPVINIHHSFLPAFKGARPYHQAYTRGVKLIGATAHYATAELDQGPIIQQDVDRVTHRDGVARLIRKGRDLEKRVLAQAVRWHLDGRVLAFGNKTVVFD